MVFSSQLLESKLAYPSTYDVVALVIEPVAVAVIELVVPGVMITVVVGAT